MKKHHLISLLLVIVVGIAALSLPLTGNSPTTTIVDDMDGNFTPAMTENVKINFSSSLSFPNSTYDLSSAIDSTVALPETGSTAHWYYTANRFDSVEIHWYSSFGAFVSEENGRYRIGGNVNNAINTPLYIGDDHFYFINEYGEIWESSEYDYTEEVLYFFPNFDLSIAEVRGMDIIGTNVLGGYDGAWNAPSEISYSVEQDIGASPALYYHTLSAVFPEDTTDMKVSLTTLPFDSDFPDYNFLQAPAFTALGRVRANGSFPLPPESSSEETPSATSSTESLSSELPPLGEISSDTPLSSDSTPISSSEFNSSSSNTSSLNSQIIDESSPSSYSQWIITFDNSSPAVVKPPISNKNATTIFGYIPPSTSDSGQIFENSSLPENYNPNWSGTKIIRPHTTWRDPAEDSSNTPGEATAFAASDYTVISSENSDQKRPSEILVVLGICVSCLGAIGYIYYKSVHSK